MTLAAKYSGFPPFLPFIFLIIPLNMHVECACNRTKVSKSENAIRPQKPPNNQQQSTLMATIAFESRNEELPSMFLRTIINEMPMNRNGIGEYSDKSEEYERLDFPDNEQNVDDNEGALIGEEYNGDGVGNGAEELVSDANAALIGHLCMLLEPKRNAIREIGNKTENSNFNKNGIRRHQVIETNAYLECLPFSQKEKEVFGIQHSFLGIWDLGQCPKGFHFDGVQQKCAEKIGINEANCEIKMQNSDGKISTMKMPLLHFNGGKGCYPQCMDEFKNNSASKLEGKVCSWLGSSFQADLFSAYHFLQCQPNKENDPCGNWIRRKCPSSKNSSTIFNSALQFCVLQMSQNDNEEMIMNSTRNDFMAKEICPQNSLPIEGQCSEGLICPGSETFCHINHCCIQLNANGKQEIFHRSIQMSQNYQTVCFGSGHPPTGPCSAGCPSKFVCQPDIGCCPHWHSNWEYLDASSDIADEADDDDYDQIGSLVCPGTENIMPEGECPNCPMNLYCVPRLHGCCPRPNKLEIDLSSSEPADSIEHLQAAIVPRFRCPGGSQVGIKCEGHFGGCSSGLGCYRGYCCPMECPPDLLPVSFCHPMPMPTIPAIPAIQSSSCIALGANCFQGVCCQTPTVAAAAILPIPIMPSVPTVAHSQMMPIVCPNGVPAKMACIGAAQCPNGFECSNGGCCPIPFCHTGLQALARCYSRMACPVGSLCTEGLCCSLPICHPGVFAIKFCGIGPNSGCGAGFECFNGGCCPYPAAACPMGIMPLGRCSAPLGCAAGSMCLNAFCCPLPTCPGPSPILATAFCSATPQIIPMVLQSTGGCQIGYECHQGGCCPLPMCPAGNLAFGRCSRMGCPKGFSCFNGLCCPPAPAPIIPVAPAIVPVAILPISPRKCSLGAIPMSLCGPNNACPIGHFCDGSNGCCPLPLPLCPFGGRAIRACIRSSDCPAGFGCIPLGGCCQFVVGPNVNPRSSICPLNQYPVCQCSAGICPHGASCNQGVCCAPNVAVSFYQPGMRCRRSPECQGADANLARCIRNICICANGAHSNGAKCVAPNPDQLKMARAGCDEFGAKCRVHLIGPRRMAIFAPSLEDGIDGPNGKADSVQKPPLWFNSLISADISPKYRSCLNKDGLKEEELLELGLGNNGKLDQQFDADKTCLPSEKCIQGKCRRRKWPGENGCIDDAECKSRCSNTICAISHKNSTTIENGEGGSCICREGSYLLFGRCLAKCPPEFIKAGFECKPIDEDKFWQNSTLLALVQKELDKMEC